MDKKLIEEQAERITSLFSYRSGYSTPKDAFMEGAEFVLNQIADVATDKLDDLLLDFYNEYDTNSINRPLIPRVYAEKIIKCIIGE